MRATVRALVIVAITLVTSVSHADDKQRALELFGESDKAYKAGEFEKAADLLRDAYKLYPEPILLYNLARALEGLGDFPGAVEQYERYLASAGDVKDRGAIERRVATMKEQIAAKQREQDELRKRQSDKSSPPPPPPPVIVEQPRASKLPYAVIGLGALTVAAGGAFGVLSKGKHDDAVAAPVQADAARLQQSAKDYALIANITYIAGGAIIVGGVIWAIVDRPAEPKLPMPAGLPPARVDVGPAYVGLAWELP